MPLPQVKTVAPEAPETPSQKAIRENRPAKSIVDARGRNILWRPISILDEARLYRAIGPEHSKNEPYMNLVRAAACVVNIDGDIGPQVTSVAFAEQRIEWLGDDGFFAIFVENSKDTEERTEDLKEAQARFRDEVKN